ncbi:serine hydrolase [Acinetobacter sp. YWS30-1]|uniref:serine hydrolase domain-containing protein n=1 Tax=Acinetobacter sp. YWS30-1 TaxID=2996862 RepID=UPI002B259E42|nr:serine hydrolase [Acinetobacter sp. YWS30-1]WPC34569.1 serine hydrolase [Acinetobacter sp. YWS30-1]
MKIRKIELYEVFIVLFIITCMGFISHFTLINRIGFWRLAYPLQGKLAIWNIHCSNNAPVWMKDSLKYIIKNQKNLSNQIAYMDTKNQVYTCQSGWKGITFFSSALNENTRFRYASLTKLVTSDAVLQQVNQGKIHLDTPLINLFPELKKQKIEDPRIQQITLSNLLEHRSGFDRMRSEDVVFAINKKSWCPYDLSELSKLKLDFEPNQRYAYDNRNYCLLGAVIENIGTQSYREYIQQHYSLNEKKIKFTDGYYYPDEVKYDFRNNNFWMESHDNKFDFKALSSSAGLSGSAKQLAILIRTMLDSKPYNILFINPNTLNNCNIQRFKSCNGYAMWQYRAGPNRPIMYFRNGGLPAVTSLAMVTSKNEVIVWMGNGATLYNEDYDENLLEKYFYKVLND